jgi:digeranylgeranylglycerophospholipid reductase
VVFSKQFLVMSHFKMDRLVAALAREAGAKIVLNYNVSSMPEGYDRLIGCDGVDSFVRKNLGLPEPNCRLGILGFTETRVSDISSVETWPCRNGFIWKIPRGAGTEYGIIADLIEARQIFSQFLEKNKIVLEGVKAKKVPQGFIMPKNYSIALCGDALGLTKPWSGGGVVWGLTAAQILLKTFPDFIKYRKAMKRFFLPKIIFSRAAVKLVYFLGFRTPWLLPGKTKMESDFLI